MTTSVMNVGKSVADRSYRSALRVVQRQISLAATTAVLLALIPLFGVIFLSAKLRDLLAGTLPGAT